MSGAIPPLPQYASMAWCSVKKRRDNFTFTLTQKGLQDEGLSPIYHVRNTEEIESRYMVSTESAVRM
jgi:hypothetical protein